MKRVPVLLAASVVVLIVAILRPDVAHLAVQALLLVALAIAALDVVVALFDKLQPSPFAAGWRSPRRPAPEVPREVSSSATELRRRGRKLPVTVASKLAELFTEKLAWRHHLSPNNAEHLPRLQQVLSPMAYFLVTARHAAWVRGKHPYERIDRTALEPLLHELEQL